MDLTKLAIRLWKESNHDPRSIGEADVSFKRGVRAISKILKENTNMTIDELKTIFEYFETMEKK